MGENVGCCKQMENEKNNANLIKKQKKLLNELKQFIANFNHVIDKGIAIKNMEKFDEDLNEKLKRLNSLTYKMSYVLLAKEDSSIYSNCVRTVDLLCNLYKCKYVNGKLYLKSQKVRFSLNSFLQFNNYEKKRKDYIGTLRKLDGNLTLAASVREEMGPYLLEAVNKTIFLIVQFSMNSLPCNFIDISNLEQYVAPIKDMYSTQKKIIKEPVDRITTLDNILSGILRTILPKISFVLYNNGLQSHTRGKTAIQASNKPTVYMYKMKSSCKTKGHSVKPMAVFVESSRENDWVLINVFFCTECDIWFINQTSYEIFRSKHGLPFVNIENDGIYSEGMDYDRYDEFANKSQLRLYGYCVGKNCPSEEARQILLAELIEFGLLSKHWIVNHLEMLISTRGNDDRLTEAISCWKKDLSFVLSYDLQISDKPIYAKIVARVKKMRNL